MNPVLFTVEVELFGGILIITSQSSSMVAESIEDNLIEFNELLIDLVSRPKEVEYSQT